jgi:hypothetical protein
MENLQMAVFDFLTSCLAFASLSSTPFFHDVFFSSSICCSASISACSKSWDDNVIHLMLYMLYDCRF